MNSYPVNLITRIGLQNNSGNKARTFGSSHSDGDLAKEKVLVARQSGCLVLLCQADLHSVSITEFEAVAAVARLVVDYPELFKVLVVACPFKVEGPLSCKG